MQPIVNAEDVSGLWAAMQRKFNLWETTCVEPYVRRGCLHGVIGKARAAASSFLEDEGRTRSPYQPLPKEDVDRLAADFRDWWSEELAAESFAVNQ